MDAVNKLLDKARDACSPKTDMALAVRLGVTRQLINQWRKGANPMSDERVAQAEKIGGFEPGERLLQVKADWVEAPRGRKQGLGLTHNFTRIRRCRHGHRPRGRCGKV